MGHKPADVVDAPMELATPRPTPLAARTLFFRAPGRQRVVSLLTTDRSLLDAFRRGDRTAMEAVYRHYAPPLSKRVASGLSGGGGRVRVSSPFEVGAVVQEVFTRAFSERARLAYDGLSPYAAYLSTIARNYLLNELRVREEPAPPEELASAVGDGGEKAQSPHEHAEASELLRLTQDFVRGRPEREQAIYQARFEQGLTQDAAAKALGLTRIQVRRAEANLRASLFTHLKAKGYLDHAAQKPQGLAAQAPEEGT